VDVVVENLARHGFLEGLVIFEEAPYANASPRCLFYFISANGEQLYELSSAEQVEFLVDDLHLLRPNDPNKVPSRPVKGTYGFLRITIMQDNTKGLLLVSFEALKDGDIQVPVAVVVERSRVCGAYQMRDKLRARRARRSGH
jgi:hypothetical protein